jgi:hypothetical protein
VTGVDEDENIQADRLCQECSFHEFSVFAGERDQECEGNCYRGWHETRVNSCLVAAARRNERKRIRKKYGSRSEWLDDMSAVEEKSMWRKSGGERQRRSAEVEVFFSPDGPP